MLVGYLMQIPLESDPIPPQILEAVRKGEKQYEFIEVMACPGGCIGGGGQPRSKVGLRGGGGAAGQGPRCGAVLRPPARCAVLCMLGWAGPTPAELPGPAGWAFGRWGAGGSGSDPAAESDRPAAPPSPAPAAVPLEQLLILRLTNTAYEQKQVYVGF